MYQFVGVVANGLSHGYRSVSTFTRIPGYEASAASTSGPRPSPNREYMTRRADHRRFGLNSR